MEKNEYEVRKMRKITKIKVEKKYMREKPSVGALKRSTKLTTLARLTKNKRKKTQNTKITILVKVGTLLLILHKQKGIQNYTKNNYTPTNWIA